MNLLIECLLRIHHFGYLNISNSVTSISPYTYSPPSSISASTSALTPFFTRMFLKVWMLANAACAGVDSLSSSVMMKLLMVGITFSSRCTPSANIVSLTFDTIIMVGDHISVLSLSMVTIEKPLEMPLAYYFHQSRQDQNDHFRFWGLYEIFSKSQIIFLLITHDQ